MTRDQMIDEAVRRYRRKQPRPFAYVVKHLASDPDVVQHAVAWIRAEWHCLVAGMRVLIEEEAGQRAIHFEFGSGVLFGQERVTQAARAGNGSGSGENQPLTGEPLPLELCGCGRTT